MENFEAKSIKSDRPTNEIEKLPDTEALNKEIQSFISELPKKEDSIDFNRLQKIGNGGTHNVFVYSKNESFVIKLNTGILEKIIDLGQSDLSPETLKRADEYMEDRNNKNEQLYKFFGKEHCLQEKVFLQKIFITQNDISKDTKGIISIQEASDVFKDPNKKDFSTGYAEKDISVEENKDIYNEMNKALLSNGEFNEENFLKFNKKLKPIFDISDTDNEFANSMKDFLLRFKNYFNETGNFIDLVGQENVLFYKQEGKWTFKLGSVIKGVNKSFMEKVMESLEKNPEIFNQDEEMMNQLINQLAFIRLLNATGLKVGIGKIIDITLSEKQLENLDRVKFMRSV